MLSSHKILIWVVIAILATISVYVLWQFYVQSITVPTASTEGSSVSTEHPNHPIHGIPEDHKHRFQQAKVTQADIDEAKKFRDDRLAACGTLDDLPRFNPSLYNDVRYRDRNNCYEYSLGLLNVSYPHLPQPGILSRLPPLKKDEISCANVRRYVQADHPRITVHEKFGDSCPCGTFQVALLVDDTSAVEERDYHFIRRDDNGYFSGKAGRGAITLVDAQNQFIVNPDRNNFDYRSQGGPNYSKRCGYLCVPHDTDQVFADAEHPVKEAWQEELPITYTPPGLMMNENLNSTVETVD